MSTQAPEAGVLNQEELAAHLNQLPVRYIQGQDWFWGAGLIGAYTPTRRAWREGIAQQLGADIDTMLASGEAAISLFALGGEAIRRREQYGGRFTNMVYTKPIGGDPIKAAGVKSIEHVSIGWGKTLPLLSIMEFNNHFSEREFALSLPELAHYVQTEQVEVAVT